MLVRQIKFHDSLHVTSQSGVVLTLSYGDFDYFVMGSLKRKIFAIREVKAHEGANYELIIEDRIVNIPIFNYLVNELIKISRSRKSSLS